MDGGHISERQRIREAVIELADTVGVTLLSMQQLSSVVSGILVALKQEPNLTPTTMDIIDSAKSSLAGSAGTRREAFDRLVNILNKLGEVDGGA